LPTENDKKKATRTRLYKWLISDLVNFILDYSIIKAISPQAAFNQKIIIYQMGGGFYPESQIKYPPKNHSQTF